MCKFCEALTDRTKEIVWEVRSTMADDNVCDFVNGDNCDVCNGCNMSFNLYGYNYDNNIHVGVSYSQELTSKNRTKVIIKPFSEGIQWNYCPICGKQISSTVQDFDDYYDHQIRINDK